MQIILHLFVHFLIHSLTHSLTLETFIDRSYAGGDGDESDAALALVVHYLEGKSCKQLDIRHGMVELVTGPCGNTEKETLSGLAESG